MSHSLIDIEHIDQWFSTGFRKHLPRVPQTASKNNLASEVIENQQQTKLSFSASIFA